MESKSYAEGAERVRSLRGSRTQVEFAPELGISPEFLSRLESGDYRPGLDLALLLQQRFGVPVHLWGKPEESAA